MATNFFGPVTIGTKVTVESGATYIRTKVEAGGRYYEGITDKEQVEEAEAELMPPLTDDDLVIYINALAPQINVQNKWFAIVKPLMWIGEIQPKDYDGAVAYIHRLFPKGLHKEFTADDIRKIDTLCFDKPLEKWSDEKAPIHGARYLSMKSLTEAFFGMISQHEKRAEKK